MKKIKIGKKFISPDHPCYVIAEIGNNHDGQLLNAKKLIKAAHAAGVDAVKFQTFKALDVVSPLVRADAYAGWDLSDRFDFWYEFVDTLKMPYECYDELIDYTHHFGLAFISTPASFEAADFLATKKIDAIKIASMDLNNIPFLKYIDRFKFPIILSTGMATLPEIKAAVKAINKSPLALLHCVSNYPLQPQDANLLNIRMLEEKFSVPVGFSNHALGYDLDIVAVGLGAKVIEKHFTLLRRPRITAEHHFSMEPKEMNEMVKKIRLIEKALGSFERTFTPAEKKSRGLVRRSITVKRDMTAGETIRWNDIVFLRPGIGIEPKDVNRVIGKKLKKPVKAYALLNWEILS